MLPGDTRTAIVCGITTEKMSDYVRVRANGFGLGSALFNSEYEMAKLQQRTEAFLTEIGRLNEQ